MEKRTLFGIFGMLTLFGIGALAGCLGGEIEHEVNNLLFDIEISGSEDTVTIQVITGDGDWADYTVMVDSTTEVRTSVISFAAGSKAVFTDPTSTWDATTGTYYTVTVKDIAKDAIVYEATVSAIA